MLMAFVMLLAVMSSYAYRVRVEYVYYNYPISTNWTSEHLAEYCDVTRNIDAINKWYTTGGGNVILKDFESDFFKLWGFRMGDTQFKGDDSFFQTLNENTVNSQGDMYVYIVVESRVMKPVATTSSSTYGTVKADPGSAQFPLPTLTLDEWPNTYDPQKWNIYYKATPTNIGNFVGWVPEKMITKYGSVENAMAFLDTEKAQMENAGYTNDMDYKIYKKFESKEFTINVAEFEEFAKICGVISGQTYQELRMRAIFKSNPKYKVYVSGVYGDVYDTNGLTPSCSSPCRDKYFEYPKGTTLSLNIKDIDEGWEFDHWEVEGYEYGSDLPLEWPIEYDEASIEAIFKETPKIQVEVSGAHGQVYDTNGLPAGCKLIYSCKDMIFEYKAGTKLSLNIKEIEDGYEFDYWKVDGYNAGSALPFEYTITKKASIEAIFKEKTSVSYIVYVESDHGTVYDRNGEELSTYLEDPCFYAESTLSLDVKDIDTGWEFDHWEVSGTNVGSDLPYSLTPDRDYIVVKAIYKKTDLKLDETYICDFTTAASKHSAYGDSWIYDSNWTVFGGANNNGQWAYAKMGGKNTTIETANPVYVVNKDAFAKEIKGVKVYYASGSLSKGTMIVAEWGVKVYSDAACSTLLYTAKSKEEITKNEETLIVYPEDNQTWSAGNYIQVYWDLANGSTTNGIIWVNKIAWMTEPVGGATGIDQIGQEPQVKSQKLIKDGQLYILRDGKIYNVMGIEIK